MNTPLKNFFKTNFVPTAVWFVAAMILGFVPATVQAATSTVTVTVGDGGTASPDYNGKQLVIGQTYKLQAKPKSGFAFTGWTGSQTTDVAKISFVMGPSLSFTASFADVKKPTLTIKTPRNKSIFTTNLIVVTGVTKDNSTVAQVFYQLNGTGWVSALTGNAWSNWWADISLDLGTNIVQAYTVDTSGNASTISKTTLYYQVVPDSINGQTLVVSSGGTANFAMTFTNTTFSQSAASTNFLDGVGIYTFARVNLLKGKLTVKYTAPPNAVSGVMTVYLQYTNVTSGFFTNGDGSTSGFAFSTATNSVPASLSGADFFLQSTNSDTQRALFFIPEPFILDNGHLSAVANPMAISISSPYAGNIGDRVSVPFITFKTTKTITNNYPGTIIGTTGDGAATNMVAVLFDSSSFISQKATPIANSLLSVLTYYYTNFISDSVDTSGLGTFTYAPYSPVGGLLSLTQTNETTFYVLTFDNTGGSGTNSGTYYEQINPASGGTSSDAGVFGFIAPPQIITQPHSIAVSNGATATFAVSASGSAPLTYQWQTNNVDLADGGNISGSSTATLNLTAVTSNNVASYLVIVGNAFGSVTSSVANLNIVAPPQIITQPQSTVVASGATAIFTVSVSGSAPLSYQWQSNSVNLFNTGNISGSATPTLTLTAVTTNDISIYSVVVTNSFGSVTSSGASLNVTP